MKPESHRELADGRTISLREVRPEDKDALASGFERMSPTSRYRRFFAPKTRLTASDLRYLTEVDHHDHEAVVAMGPDGEPVGVARYVKTAADKAEVAIAVVDDWQGNGAGTALLERLTERARENGIRQFVALILQDNKEAKDLFRTVVGHEHEGQVQPSGELEMVMDLPDSDEQDSGPARALRGAASGRLVIHPWRTIMRRIGALHQDDADAGDDDGN